MKNNPKKNILKINEQAFNEMYVVNTLINVTKQTCEEREFNGIYYGLKGDITKKISSERNDYINMLSVLSDKISSIMSLYVLMEKELTL